MTQVTLVGVPVDDRLSAALDGRFRLHEIVLGCRGSGHGNPAARSRAARRGLHLDRS
jgi:hypothetical protein